MSRESAIVTLIDRALDIIQSRPHTTRYFCPLSRSSFPPSPPPLRGEARRVVQRFLPLFSRFLFFLLPFATHADASDAACNKSSGLTRSESDLTILVPVI